MPDAAQWLGITVVVLGVLGGVWLLFWLLSLIVS
jgi:hypothetical protein